MQGSFTIIDLATAMSRINRWAGRGEFALSIAQHSVLLSVMVPAHLARAAIIHDCSEVFMGGDVISPIKDRCPDLQFEEERIQRRLFSLFEVPWVRMLELTPFDVCIRFDEAAALFPDEEWAQTDRHRGLGVPVEPMEPTAAAEAWLKRFIHLFHGEFE